MSVFSNPANQAAEGAERYIRAVLDLLGDHDPREVLGTTAAWCAARTAGLSEGQLRRPEAPGKWSVAAVLQHLADSEVVWGYRLRKVLAEERPILTGFDQDLWAERLRYDQAEHDRALELFGTLREANLALLASASEDDLERVGVHAERGDESVAHMIRLYAGHDLVHRRQLARVVSVVGGGTT